MVAYVLDAEGVASSVGGYAFEVDAGWLVALGCADELSWAEGGVMRKDQVVLGGDGGVKFALCDDAA